MAESTVPPKSEPVPTQALPGDDYVSEPGDGLFTDPVGDIYARKPDGRVYDLTD